MKIGHSAVVLSRSNIDTAMFDEMGTRVLDLLFRQHGRKCQALPGTTVVVHQMCYCSTKCGADNRSNTMENVSFSRLYSPSFLSTTNLTPKIIICIKLI